MNDTFEDLEPLAVSYTSAVDKDVGAPPKAEVALQLPDWLEPSSHNNNGGPSANIIIKAASSKNGNNANQLYSFLCPPTMTVSSSSNKIVDDDQDCCAMSVSATSSAGSTSCTDHSSSSAYSLGELIPDAASLLLDFEESEHDDDPDLFKPPTDSAVQAVEVQFDADDLAAFFGCGEGAMEHPPRSCLASPKSKSRRKNRFGESHTRKWDERYVALKGFVLQHGHACVPLENYTPDPSLSHWVKRQRYQKKQKDAGRSSTLTDEREQLLNAIGFVWDSHSVAWMERWNQLRRFKECFGHCNVTSKYGNNVHSLGIWVKCQRRQYQLLKNGDKHHLAPERIERLDSLGFDWAPRSSSSSSKSKKGFSK